MPEERSTGRLLREAITQAIAAGATIDEIEVALIDSADVAQDARDALWLFAWGSLERQRPVVA